jgi:hypothetical protein
MRQFIVGEESVSGRLHREYDSIQPFFFTVKGSEN